MPKCIHVQIIQHGIFSSSSLQARNKEIRLKEKTKGILGMATAGVAATAIGGSGSGGGGGGGAGSAAGAALKAFASGSQGGDSIDI